MKKSYPINKFTADIEVLGGEITLTELTQDFRDHCNDDSGFDTPRNALINAGLTEDQVDKLGVNVIVAIYNDIVDFTYPNMREEYEKMISEKDYTPPTEEEIEDSKKK